MSEQTQRAAVVAEARTWLGTKYHHKGRVKGAGVDCGMLLLEVYARCGVLVPEAVADYPRDWHLHRDEERYLAEVVRYAHPVDAPQPGDFAVWRFGRTFSHGAIVVDWPLVIHSYIGRGVVLDDALRNLDLGERPRLFFSCWRPEGE